MQATARIQQLLFDLQVTDTKIRHIRNEAEELEETRKLKMLIEQRKVLAMQQAQLSSRAQKAQLALDDIAQQESKLAEHLDQLTTSQKATSDSAKLATIAQKRAAAQARLKELDSEKASAQDVKAQCEHSITILGKNDERLRDSGMALKRRREAVLHHLGEKITIQKERRGIAVHALPPELVETYMRFNKAKAESEEGGPVVVRFTHGELESQKVSLSAQELSEVQAAHPYDVVALEGAHVLVCVM